jgi:hypothetical protein
MHYCDRGRVPTSDTRLCHFPNQLHSSVPLMDHTAICTKVHCKNIIPESDININGQKYRKCQSCRTKDNIATAARRKRQREEVAEPPQHAAPSAPSSNGHDLVAAELQVTSRPWENDSSEEEQSDIVSFTRNKYISCTHLA